MPEDSGKKKYIKSFLQQVQGGEGFIEDIWIQRDVRLPGTSGKGSIAKSLSGRTVSNITELLEDDLKHSLDDGYFTFRFVAALIGSGKTSLLTYLNELTKNKPNYKNLCIAVRFQLSDLLNVGGKQSFSIKLYCHILAQTFWELLHNKDLSISVIKVAETILSELLESAQVAQLKSARNFKIQFAPKFNKYLIDSGVGFEDFFFYVIDEIAVIEPLFTFVYLTDELDALEQYPNHIQDTRALFKALVKRARQQFNSKIRLLIYLGGTSNNVDSFIEGDPVLKSIVDSSVITLISHQEELETIRKKIDHRIEGAYKGYKNFDIAWQEIRNIRLNPANTLREFCKEYASKVLEIHEKYFREAPEQVFEGNARQLVEAQCKQKWANYLNKSAYSLSEVFTSTVLEGHAFDCYVKLLHNGRSVARAFGEAKNYELLSEHLQTFEKWLGDVNFNPSTLDGTPSDLAFMIAPSCPYLLQRKLELQNIEFIQADKITKPETEKVISPLLTPAQKSNAVNVNTSDRTVLAKTFKGTGFGPQKIGQLIKNRPLKNLDELVSRVKFSEKVKYNIQQKINNGEICF